MEELREDVLNAIKKIRNEVDRNSVPAAETWVREHCAEFTGREQYLVLMGYLSEEKVELPKKLGRPPRKKVVDSVEGVGE